MRDPRRAHVGPHHGRHRIEGVVAAGDELDDDGLAVEHLSQYLRSVGYVPLIVAFHAADSNGKGGAGWGSSTAVARSRAVDQEALGVTVVASRDR